jgi:hypothetical protein
MWLTYTCSSFASCNVLLLAIFVASRLALQPASHDPVSKTITYRAPDGSDKRIPFDAPPPPECSYLVDPALLHPFDPQRVVTSNARVAKLNLLCAVCSVLAIYVLVHG